MGPLLEVEGLAKHYPMRRGLVVQRTVGTVRAVDGLGFTLAAGETLALVGESGCGKSTTARLVLRLIEPSAGVVRFEGADITGLEGAALRAVRFVWYIGVPGPRRGWQPPLPRTIPIVLLARVEDANAIVQKKLPVLDRRGLLQFEECPRRLPWPL